MYTVTVLTSNIVDSKVSEIGLIRKSILFYFAKYEINIYFGKFL
jgi:hypothetical protein